jgi:hypothetical protein
MAHRHYGLPAAVLAFFDELRVNGFIEGQNLTVISDGFAADNERLAELAAAVRFVLGVVLGCLLRYSRQRLRRWCIWIRTAEGLDCHQGRRRGLLRSRSGYGPERNPV